MLKTSNKETCSIVTLPTINSIWIVLGQNPSLHSEKPASDYDSHGIATSQRWYHIHWTVDEDWRTDPKTAPAFCCDEL